jgi:hypothetical protein
MVQRQVAFENTKQQREAPTLSNIAPKWAKRLGEHQELLVPMSITWLRWYFELKRASRCVVGEAHRYSSSCMYECRECDEIGWRFRLQFAVHSCSKLEENKQRLVNHWNREHARSTLGQDRLW